MLEFDSITKVATRTWRFAWTATGNVDIYSNSRLIEYNYEGASYDYESNTAYPPALEVVDTGDTPPDSYQHPSYLTLQWYGVDGASHYRIEQYVSGAWVIRRRLYDDGRGYFAIVTDELEDCTTQQWRIIPVDAYNGDGAALEYNVSFARVPAPPSVTYTYSATTGLVTVAAGA